MNKYTIIKNTFITLIAIAVVSGYTYAGIYSGSALMALCAIMLWMGIIGWSIILTIQWLTKKEKEYESNE